MTIGLQVEGIEQIERLAATIERELNPLALTERALIIARAAGEMLKAESVKQIIELIYDQPSPEVLFSGSGLMVHGGSDDRTEDLMDSITLSEDDAGFTQIVQVDPTMPVSENAHDGRENVIDYAVPVHEGYMQFVFGTDTGAFHPGRPWFTRAGIEATPTILAFVQQAFEEVVTNALRGVL